MSKLLLSITSQLLVSFVASFTFITSIYANEVGSLPGEFNVSPSGAATYTIPIEVPPGINGLQPSLAFIYNNQSGNGLLGQGWGLSGLSSIARCTQTLEQDDNIHGVDFTTADRLCLDGQRLYPVNGANTDSGYWSAFEYRTEIESFSKVTRYGTGFKVETKDGRVAEYGNTYDSVQNLSGIAQPLSWAVNKIRDQLNNSIIYTYNKNVINGEHNISEIAYANNGLVKFNYNNNRADQTTEYLSGSLIKKTQILTSIETRKNSDFVKKYNLNYENSSSSGISTLVDIQECAGLITSSCKKSTELIWQGGGNGSFLGMKSKSHAGGGWASSWKLLSGDYDGNGISDICASFTNSSGWRTQCALSDGNGGFKTMATDWHSTGRWGTTWKMITGDYNGDGKTDICASYTGSGWTTHCVLSNGNGSFGNITTDLHASGSWATTWEMFPGDYDGDGRTDICTSFTNSSGWRTHCVLSNGNGSFGNMKTDWHSTGSWATSWKKLPGDYNGDGLNDLCVSYTGSGWTTHCVLSNGDGTFGNMTSDTHATGSWATTWEMLPGDYNADGLLDICTSFTSSSGWRTHCVLSEGNGSFASMTTDWHSRGSWATTWKKLPGDYNGDGLIDLCVSYTGSGWTTHCVLSNGDGTFGNMTSDTLATGSWATSWKMLPGDYNGDGVSDICTSLTYSSGWYSHCALNDSNGTDLMVKVSDGFEKTTDISYLPITNNSIYTKDATAKYPVIDIQAAINVVSSVKSDNGLGGKNETKYKYAGLKVHQRGRGFLGFRQMQITNQQTGIKSKTDFSQKFPNVGAPVKTVVSQANGWVLSSSASDFTYNGYTCVRYPVAQWSLPNCGNNQPGIVFPYSTGSTSTQYDLNRALIKTVKTNSTQGVFSDNFVDSTTTTVTTTGSTGAVYKQVATDTFGNSYSSVYSKKGQLTQTQSYSVVNGNYSPTVTKAFTYNTKGKLFTDTLEPGTGDELTKTYGYDNFGNRTSVKVSGAGITNRTSSTIYDNNGQFPKTVTNALEHSETHVYDPRFGSLKSRTGPNGLTTSYEFDRFGRKTATVNARLNRNEISRQWCNVNLGHVCTIPAINTGNSVQTASQSVSYVITSRQKGSNLVEYAPPAKIYYDKFNREVRKESTGFDGVAVYVDTNYDSQGRVSAKTQPYFSDGTSDKNPTSFTYDVLGRVTNQYSPTGTRNQILYNGLVVTTNSFVTSPSRTETKLETSNPIGQLISVRDNAYQTTRFGYNPQGKRTTTTDPLGNVITIGYDKFGRKISMTDPDMGQWFYTYNVLGELLTQKDAKLQLTSMQYDLLGRLTRRNDHDGLTSAWYYNDNGGTSSRTKGVGKLDYVTSSNGYRKDLYYNNYGEPTASIVAISGAGSSARTDTSYDAYGRINAITYPESIGRFQVKHAYKNGFLEKVTSSNNAITYWQADLRRANGQVQYDSYGANLQVSRDFDSGERIKWLNISASTMLYEAFYGYDSIGNITTRSSQRNQGNRVVFNESYTYDNLNRLTDVNMAGVGSITRGYDALGNIERKNNNYYTYYANRPHAVKTALGNTYNYDANGNMSNGAGRSMTWTSHNKPSRIVKGTSNSNFLYGPSRKRFYHQQTNGTASQNKTTYYIGTLFEKEIKGGVTEYKHYIRGGGKTIAVHTRKSGVANKTDYLLRDYQGTVVAIADEAGIIKGHMDYDAFGARRPVQGLSQIDQIIQSFPRGYTGHEHLDNVGLIHMNGRVYDAVLGRFLSADPLVQAPNNLQSLNRYSYVFNNPMSYTDPSGFRSLRKHIRRLGKNVLKVIGALSSFGLRTNLVTGQGYLRPVRKFMKRSKVARIAGSILSGITGGPGGALLYSSYLADISGASNEDIGKAGLISYGSTVLFEAVNAPYGNAWNLGRVIDNGLAGGIVSELSGGKFGDGFKVAGLMSLAKWAFFGIANSVNDSSVRSGNTLRDPRTGELFTYGGRGTVTITGEGTFDKSLLAGLNMTQEVNGESNWWWGSDWIRGSFNAISKPHDWGNSWAYNSVGQWVSHGVTRDTLFNIYSISTMLPAAVFTAYASTPISPVISYRANR